MAGLLAWAADVVGGGGQSNEEDDSNRFPIVVFTPDQQKYARELEQRAASLSRSIQDLRLRIPPPHISQRLPHLHAHSVASNAALALQLNSHSATREQAQLREVTLQEENAAYEKAILNCQKKIQEKFQEADLLQSKLKEMDITENSLRTELVKSQATLDLSQSCRSLDDSKTTEALDDREPPNNTILEELDDKRRELNSMNEVVQNLEDKWTMIQRISVRQPSPAQREKILEKQLQSLIEQLGAKQAQAESMATEIHVKEQELEKLNGLRRRIENGNFEVKSAKNRFRRISSMMGPAAMDYIGEGNCSRPYVGGRTENQEKLMLMRSAFVLYILALQLLVFIKISF